jgi:hypothetical protein
VLVSIVAVEPSRATGALSCPTQTVERDYQIDY